MFLRLSGKECSRWESSSTSGSETGSEKFNSKSIFYNSRCLVHEGAIAMGCHAFPFKFRLSENLPGTVSASTDTYMARVVYKLEVMLKGLAKHVHELHIR
jgi:hypothetical protein